MLYSCKKDVNTFLTLEFLYFLFLYFIFLVLLLNNSLLEIVHVTFACDKP